MSKTRIDLGLLNEIKEWDNHPGDIEEDFLTDEECAEINKNITRVAVSQSNITRLYYIAIERLQAEKAKATSVKVTYRINNEDFGILHLSEYDNCNFFQRYNPGELLKCPRVCMLPKEASNLGVFGFKKGNPIEVEFNQNLEVISISNKVGDREKIIWSSI